MTEMQSRVAVVTGGASGMGEATCRELGRRGLKVAVLDIHGEAAARVAEELRSAGVTALGVEVDVTNRPAVQEAFAKVRAELGPVAVLVTSAGKAGFSRFADITVESWSEMIDINLTVNISLLSGGAARHGRREVGPRCDDLLFECTTRIALHGALRGSQGRGHNVGPNHLPASTRRKESRSTTSHPRASIRRCRASRRPKARWARRSNWRNVSRWATWALPTTSPLRWVSCARRRRDSSPARCSASTADR